MDERLVWQALSGVIGIAIFAAFAVASGVLPWAIFAGVGTFLLLDIVSNEWYDAFVFGVVVAGLISVLCIVAKLSPGWYKSLL